MKIPLLRHPAPRSAGFTLVELMVSTALIALLMLLLLNTVDQTQQVWTRTTGKVAQFQASRAAFEAMTRRLGQATLNTYYRAHDTNSANTKADLLFRRHSELQFLTGSLADFTSKSGKVPGIFTSSPALESLTEPKELAYPTHGVFFFAPLGVTEEPGLAPYQATRRFRGLDGMLTACGYFIEYGDDPARPKFLPRDVVPPRNRFRLMEMTVPAEKLTVYSRPIVTGDDPLKVPWRYSTAPQILDAKNNHYTGRVDNNLRSTATWVRPLWMIEALKRSTEGSLTQLSHFTYGRVMADNVIALVVLPKLAERDRSTPTAIGDLSPEYQYDSWRILRQDGAGAVGIANSARDNLLPPIIQIVMVAIDESSALRLSVDTPSDWTRSPRELFTSVKNEGDLLADLTELENRLQKSRVNYRVFSTDVVIRGSKHSKDPK